jgi:hypothetical protein
MFSMIKKIDGSEVVLAITFVGKLDISYEFFIVKIFSNKCNITRL